MKQTQHRDAARGKEQSTKLARRNRGAIALLRRWRVEGDMREQKETGGYLVKALDEDRPAKRKLFP